MYAWCFVPQVHGSGAGTHWSWLSACIQGRGVQLGLTDQFTICSEGETYLPPQRHKAKVTMYNSSAVKYDLTVSVPLPHTGPGQVWRHFLFALTMVMLCTHMQSKQSKLHQRAPGCSQNEMREIQLTPAAGGGWLRRGVVPWRCVDEGTQRRAAHRPVSPGPFLRFNMIEKMRSCLWKLPSWWTALEETNYW